MTLSLGVNTAQRQQNTLHCFLITQQTIAALHETTQKDVSLNDDSNNGDKKVFQLKVNRPLVDRWMGYIVNKFESPKGWSQVDPNVSRGVLGLRGVRNWTTLNMSRRVPCDVWLNNGITPSAKRMTDRHDWKQLSSCNFVVGGNNRENPSKCHRGSGVSVR